MQTIQSQQFSALPQSPLFPTELDCLQWVLLHGGHLDKHSYSDLKLSSTAPKRHGLALNLELSDLSGFTGQQAPRDPRDTIAHVLRFQECTRIPDFLKYKCRSRFLGTKQSVTEPSLLPLLFYTSNKPLKQLSVWI